MITVWITLLVNKSALFQAVGFGAVPIVFLGVCYFNENMKQKVLFHLIFFKVKFFRILLLFSEPRICHNSSRISNTKIKGIRNEIIITHD